MVVAPESLSKLNAEELRVVVNELLQTVANKDADLARRDAEITFKQAVIDKITHEMAVLKRLKFAAQSEHFNAEQRSLLEETIDADLQALEAELEQVAPVEKTPGEKQQPKRQVLPSACW